MRWNMLKGLRNLFSSGPVPYADPNAKIPLSEVLKRDWFELWYQPKIELKTMRLVGAEALVRARHPTRGVVAPYFLSLIHISEPTRQAEISYAVFCLKK